MRNKYFFFQQKNMLFSYYIKSAQTRNLGLSFAVFFSFIFTPSKVVLEVKELFI